MKFCVFLDITDDSKVVHGAFEGVNYVIHVTNVVFWANKWFPAANEDRPTAGTDHATMNGSLTVLVLYFFFFALERLICYS